MAEHRGRPALDVGSGLVVTSPVLDRLHAVADAARAAVVHDLYAATPDGARAIGALVDALTALADTPSATPGPLDVVRRLVDNLQQFIDDVPDCGTEALAAIWEARQLLRRHERTARRVDWAAAIVGVLRDEDTDLDSDGRYAVARRILAALGEATGEEASATSFAAQLDELTIGDQHRVSKHWDHVGGDVLERSCSCGNRWTADVDVCVEAPYADDEHGVAWSTVAALAARVQRHEVDEHQAADVIGQALRAGVRG